MENKIISDTIWAWVAGFWEGEGCAGYYSKGAGKGRRLDVGISQKNPAILHWIKSALGYGHISVAGKGIYQWRIRGTKERNSCFLSIRI